MAGEREIAVAHGEREWIRERIEAFEVAPCLRLRAGAEREIAFWQCGEDDAIDVGFERVGRWVFLWRGHLLNAEDFAPHPSCSIGAASVLAEVFQGASWSGLPSRINRLRGRFSAIVWDTQWDTLYWFRDRFGLVPLSYVRLGQDRCIVGSGAGITFRAAGLSPEPNIAFIRRLLLGQLSSDFSRVGPLSGIQRSFPGEVARWRAGERPEAASYWRPSTSTAVPSGSLPDQFRTLLENRVESFHESVGEFCPTLSGGLDSSFVAALYADVRTATFEQPLPCVSMISRRYPAMDESRRIMQLEDAFPLRSHRFLIDDLWVLKPGVLAGDPQLADGPLYHPSLYWAVPFFRWAAGRVEGRRFSTGEGADILQAASLTQIVSHGLRARQARVLLEACWHQPRSFAKCLLQLIAAKAQIDEPLRHLVRRVRGLAHELPPWQRMDWIIEDESTSRQCVKMPESSRWDSHGEHKCRFLRAWNFERATRMFCELEHRAKVRLEHPFFDRRLWEMVLALSPELLSSNGLAKSIQRAAMAESFPAGVLTRRSRALFDNVTEYGLGIAEGDFIEDLFSSGGSHLEAVGVIDARRYLAAYKSYREHVSAHWPSNVHVGSQPIWRVVASELWLRALSQTSQGSVRMRI